MEKGLGVTDLYRRTIRVDGAHGIVEVRPDAGADHLLARIRLPSAAALIAVAERLRRIFDLGADPDEISRHLGADPPLRRRLSALPGLRVPGAWDGFELAVRAILGQQVTVKGATTLAGRLAATYGDKLEPSAADGADDVASGWIRPVQPVEVLLVSAPSPLVKELQDVTAASAAMRLTVVHPDDIDAAAVGDFGIAIYHTFVPAAWQGSNALFVHPADRHLDPTSRPAGFPAQLFGVLVHDAFLRTLKASRIVP